MYQKQLKISLIKIQERITLKIVNHFLSLLGGFFKICLNLIEEKTLKKSGRKKAMYLDSSVKKLFILAIVQGVPETYKNVEKILEALKLENVEFKFCLATDMKLQNIIMGLQSNSAAFPCVYCESRRPFDIPGLLRTLGRIRELSRKFIEIGAKLKDAQDYLNAVNEPLFSASDDAQIIEILPIPELHLHIGIGKIEK